jgi:hypothetical protein
LTSPLYSFWLCQAQIRGRQKRETSYEKVKKKMQCSLADSSECIGPRSMV